MTAGGDVEFVSRPVLEYFGKALDELKNWTIGNEVHPEDLPGVLLAWKHSIATGETYHAEHRLRRFDGVFRWFQARATPARRADSTIERWYLLLTDIEDRKRSEQIAQESQMAFRTIVDSIPGMVHTMRADGSVEFVNQRVLDFFGKTLEELRENWAPAVHPEERETVLQAWSASVATGEPYESLHRVLRADGEWRWFSSRGLPLRDASGQIVRWYNLLVDVDERKRAQDALRASEQNLRLMLDSIAGMVTVFAASGELEAANKPFLDYTGHTIEDLRADRGVLHPDDRAAVMDGWQCALRTGEPFRSEMRLRGRDGTFRWFEASVLPLCDEVGRITRWYSLTTDIDDRKNAEAALQRSQRELTLMIETIPGLVWCASPDGELTYINERIHRYFGAQDRDLMKGGWAQFLHPDDVAQTVDAWSNSVATREPFAVQARLRGTDGTFRWFHSLGQLGLDSQGNPSRWYGLMIDIDEAKRIEDTLRTTQEQLSHAAQVATLGELSASIAHEVNQPLAAVVANGHACLRWLAAEPPNLEKTGEAAERVVRDGRDAADVLRRIRALFKRSENQREKLNLNNVVVEVAGLVRTETLRQNVSVVLDLEEDLPPLMADRVQLQQLILNIFINAIDAMRMIDNGARRIAVRSRRAGASQILMEIADSGAGIADKAPVFDTFFSTKTNGMGMGLAICRSIVESHGGRIWAENVPGCGAKFCFLLPHDGASL